MNRVDTAMNGNTASLSVQNEIESRSFTPVQNEIVTEFCTKFCQNFVDITTQMATGELNCKDSVVAAGYFSKAESLSKPIQAIKYIEIIRESNNCEHVSARLTLRVAFGGGDVIISVRPVKKSRVAFHYA